MIQRFNKKIIHLCVIIVIIVAIIFTALIFILNYNENGETNMPFEVTKIAIISTTNGEDVENDDESKWNLQVNQDNDIYIYIEKNENYKKTETIKKIIINNIKITKEVENGNFITYRPSTDENAIFEDIEEYETQELEFTGDKTSDIQNLKISNQGGILAFRCANKDLATYTSDKDEEINFSELLKKLNIENSDLKAEVSFDMTIVLNSGKSYQATFSNIEIPTGDIVTEGTTSHEITDLDDIVFKRIEN
jgi:hypothetical protein